MYATAAGRTASDGDGRNGFFTSHLLTHLSTPGIDVNEVFRRTMGDVTRASNGEQRPALYTDFADVAYLGSRPVSPPVGTEAVAYTAQPAPMPLPGTEKIRPAKPQREKAEPTKAARLWSVGFSMGSTFFAPLIIGTVRGTIAPFDFSFVEFGLDGGLLSFYQNNEYYSLYPYVHYNVYIPLSNSGKGGWYAGLGAGYMYSQYTFDENSDAYEYFGSEHASFNHFAGDVVAGVNIADMIDISYTFRTTFKSASNKLSVGYMLRF